MTVATEGGDLAPVYSGLSFPVEKLSPGKFEEFVFACVLSAADVLGLRVTGKPSGSGDGGFDVQGASIASSRIACLQCKRQSAPLGIAQVASELAKVAATSTLEGSDVGEHRFICTGGVRKSLRTQLRQQGRQDLVAMAGDYLAGASQGELSALREKLEVSGHDPRLIAESYVRNLDVLLVWSFQEFDVALSARWDSVLQIAERYFQVASFVREHPRASFDREAYVAEHRGFCLAAEPRVGNASLPVGIAAASLGNPGSSGEASPERITSWRDFAGLQGGNLIVLLGDGGAGKTAFLNLIRATALRDDPDSSLPIVISLANYVPGELDRAIHQELGVDHGTWRSLPDRIVLLCDGLNECSVPYATAFLDELRILLRRKRVACIISTRASSGRGHIVLPQMPVGCLQLASLTPVGIRRIAEHALPDGGADAFVVAYRALIDRASSPLLWTPFAVLTALDLWRSNSVIPSTIGEMLELVLRARSRRAVEQSLPPLSPSMTLRLAEALAFQSLVIERRLECPEAEAGSWVRQAKSRCANVLGIADLTETQVVDILIAHGLLYLSASGYYRFDHHLIAGALAARMLAQNWRSEADSLKDSMLDDAWAFAARFVPRQEAPEFLRRTFDSDLVLGARTASEVPDFAFQAMELLDRCVAPESPEVVRIRGVFALATLGTAAAVSKLREMRQHVNDPIENVINMALAAAGDEDYLRSLLNEVDPMKSGPVRVSGGPIAIWETAPLSRRLDLARRRLAERAPGEPVGESLSLVAFERDSSDVGLFERHFQAATHSSAWINALRAIYLVKPSRAKAHVEQILKAAPTIEARARVIRVALIAGVEPDIRLAFDCAVCVLSDGEDTQSTHDELRRLIAGVIGHINLPLELVQVVENELPGSVGERRSRLWQTAMQCESGMIAEYCASRIDPWSEDADFACTYLILRPHLARAHRLQLIEACENRLEVLSAYDWSIERALSLIEKLGFSEKAANTLTQVLECLARALQTANRDEPSAVEVNETQTMSVAELAKSRTYLAMQVANLMPVVAKVYASLPPSTLLSLLHFELQSHSVSMEVRTALSGQSDDRIDEVLAQVSDPWATLSSLVIVCPRGATEARTRLLEVQLRKGYAHPAILTLLRQAVESCWCESVFDMILTVVVQIPVWAEYDSQFFWEFALMVAKKVTLEHIGKIEAAAAISQTGFAKHVLGVWRVQALGERIGFGMMPGKRSGVC